MKGRKTITISPLKTPAECRRRPEAYASGSPCASGPPCGCRIRKSFTLVELLVVIVIIAILAALIASVAHKARISAMNARMKLEVMALDQALNAFKARFGAYPPDGVTLTNFLSVAFPRYGGGMPTKNPLTGAALPLNTHLAEVWVVGTYNASGPGVTSGPNGQFLTPATALVFWLGGMQDANGNFIGFSADPTDPFDAKYATIHGAGTYQKNRIGPFFDFQKSRVSGYFYFPDNGLGTNINANSPYVYFVGPYTINQADILVFGPGTCTYTSNQTYFNAWWGLPPPNGMHVASPGGVACTAYYDTRLPGGAFVNQDTLQILCPGMDGAFGAGNSYPTGMPIGTTPIYMANTPANNDDITNFTKGTTIQDDLP